MTITKTVQDGACHISLVGDIKIYEAMNNKQEMFSELESYQSLKLDISQIEDIDASGLQLLILLRKEVKERNIPFELVAMSTPVLKLLELYRLKDWFQYARFW